MLFFKKKYGVWFILGTRYNIFKKRLGVFGEKKL